MLRVHKKYHCSSLSEKEMGTYRKKPFGSGLEATERGSNACSKIARVFEMTHVAATPVYIVAIARV